MDCDCVRKDMILIFGFLPDLCISLCYIGQLHNADLNLYKQHISYLKHIFIICEISNVLSQYIYVKYIHVNKDKKTLCEIHRMIIKYCKNSYKTVLK